MAVKERVLPIEDLKAILTYDKETGLFLWAMDRPGVRKYKKAGSWDWRRAKGGSYVIRIGSRDVYFAHKLAYYYMTGVWPRHKLTFLDGNRGNLSWENIGEKRHPELGTS